MSFFAVSARSRRRLRELRSKTRSNNLGSATESSESASPRRALRVGETRCDGLAQLCLARGCRWSCSKRWLPALPVIATRVEGTPEAITHGVEGLLAEPRDAASLAEAIRSLITGQTTGRQMAEAAVTRHGRCFSDLAMAGGTADVYRELCSHRRLAFVPWLADGSSLDHLVADSCCRSCHDAVDCDRLERSPPADSDRVRLSIPSAILFEF